MRRIGGVAAIALMVGVLVSCARSVPTSPCVVPDTFDGSHSGSGLLLPESRSLLGLYRIVIPADRLEAAIVPDRAATYHFNVLRKLEVQPCTDCLSIESIDRVTENRLQVEIKLTHPFASEHKGLTGFDVRGIVMLPGNVDFPAAGVSVPWEDEDGAAIVGPDGYTRLFNPEEFAPSKNGPPALRYIIGRYATPEFESATVNPYLVFVPEAERNHFPAGSSATRVYDFKLPDGRAELGYAVDVSWHPVGGPVENVPDDFPLSANSQEAYKIYVSIGKGLTPTGTGTARVMVEAFDWQGVDTIDEVLIEAPDLYDGEVEASLSTVGDERFVFYGQIQNSKQAPVGDYPLLVTVRDKVVDPNLGPLAAYQIATAHVTLSGVWIRELVHIPAGDFIMGGDPDFDPQVNPWVGETPQHVHPTGEYYVSRFEITNEEYAAFIADGGYHDPAYWSLEGWEWRVENDVTAPSSWNMWPKITTYNGLRFPDYPIYCISWFEAEAFCRWAGGRLPTEAEWEKAARGTDGRIWPWGNEWDWTLCRCHANGKGPLPIGSYSPEGDSPYHVADAAGNVIEWCADWFDYDIYDQYATGDFRLPEHPTYANDRVVKGGHFADTYASGDLRTSNRCGYSDHNQSGAIRIVFDP